MDFKTETQYRQEISVVLGMIDQLKADNAALKEQVAQLKSSVQHEADCVDSAAAEINRKAAENDKLKETIAQQAEAIRMKDAVLNRIMLNGWGLWALTDIAEALSIQPSPEILQARDEWVAEAQGKAVSNLITGTTAKQYQEAIDKAYEQGKKDAVPEGWVLVPVKPTPEMINAAANVSPAPEC